MDRPRPSYSRSLWSSPLKLLGQYHEPLFPGGAGRRPSLPTTQEALSFLALPDKVKRQQFEPDELIMLRAECEIALLDHPSLKRRRSSAAGVVAEGARREGTRSTMTVPAASWTEKPRSSGSDRAGLVGESKRRRTSASSRRGGSSARDPSTSWLDTTGTQVPLPSTGGGNAAAKATFYHDPQARGKLRKLVESPEAFDEIVKYGFPCGDEGVADEEDVVAGDSGSEDYLSDSKTDDDEDDSEGGDVDGDDEKKENTGLVKHKHHIASHHTKRQRAREMTLRMTLTKPEVQSSNLVTTPAAPDRQSLALAPLTFSDDTTGRYGAFSAAPSAGRRLRELWRFAINGGQG